MTEDIASKLQEFITVNEGSLYATRVTKDGVYNRPYNIRCEIDNKNHFLLVRWMSAEEQANLDILHEVCELLNDVNAFNVRQ